MLKHNNAFTAGILLQSFAKSAQKLNINLWYPWNSKRKTTVPSISKCSIIMKMCAICGTPTLFRDVGFIFVNKLYTKKCD